MMPESSSSSTPSNLRSQEDSSSGSGRLSCCRRLSFENFPSPNLIPGEITSAEYRLKCLVDEESQILGQKYHFDFEKDRPKSGEGPYHWETVNSADLPAFYRNTTIANQRNLQKGGGKYREQLLPAANNSKTSSGTQPTMSHRENGATTPLQHEGARHNENQREVSMEEREMDDQVVPKPT